MPRLNGRFVSQAVFDAAMLDLETHDIPMKETPVTDTVDTTEETAATDKRFGLRPETVYKRALSAEVSAQVTYQKAVRRLTTYEDKGEVLRTAVESAQAALDAATEAAAVARTEFNGS